MVSEPTARDACMHLCNSSSLRKMMMSWAGEDSWGCMYVFLPAASQHQHRPASVLEHQQTMLEIMSCNLFALISFFLGLVSQQRMSASSCINSFDLHPFPGQFPYFISKSIQQTKFLNSAGLFSGPVMWNHQTTSHNINLKRCKCCGWAAFILNV